MGPASAVGKVAGPLAVHSQSVPRGAEICALEEALQAPSGKGKSTVSERCEKGLNSDQLWRGAMTVLAGYGEHLDAVSSGDDPAMSGQLVAARSGIRTASWVEVDDAAEKTARSAVFELVSDMEQRKADDKLDTVVKAAAPRVTSICEGLERYLAKQTESLTKLRKEVPEKEAAPGARRCAMLDNRPICLADSVVDHAFYASQLGHLAALESNHRGAHDTVAAFCAAHAELEKAAASGALTDDATAKQVIDAVKRAMPQQASQGPAAGSAPSKGGKSEGGKSEGGKSEGGKSEGGKSEGGKSEGGKSESAP
jgi:hypothetical protein